MAYYYLVIVKAKSVSLGLGVSTKGSEGKMHKSRFSELWLENEQGACKHMPIIVSRYFNGLTKPAQTAYCNLTRTLFVCAFYLLYFLGHPLTCHMMDSLVYTRHLYSFTHTLEINAFMSQKFLSNDCDDILKIFSGHTNIC